MAPIHFYKKWHITQKTVISALKITWIILTLTHVFLGPRECTQVTHSSRTSQIPAHAN